MDCTIKISVFVYGGVHVFKFVFDILDPEQNAPVHGEFMQWITGAAPRSSLPLLMAAMGNILMASLVERSIESKHATGKRHGALLKLKPIF